MNPHSPLVLVVDDEQNAVMLLTRILKRDGFEVEIAEDGEIALEKAQALHPDLILMDVQMPKLDGFEVMERLREDPGTSRIPVIFVTAAAREPSDVAHGFQLGADDYVRKPYNYHELLARAHSKMRARQLEDHLQRRSEELEALVRIGGEFNQRLGLDELVDLILAVATKEFQTKYAELFLLDEHRQPLLYRSTSAHPGSIEQAAAMLERDDTVVGQAVRAGEPILLTTIQQETAPLYYGDHLTLNSVLVAPLRHHGNLVGILTVGRKTPQEFSDNDLRLLRSIGEQAALAVCNAKLYAELQSYAANLEAMVEARTEELRAAQTQLVRTEKLAALGRLAAGVAHEVNNPLQPILNCLEVTIEDIENGDRVDVEVLRVAEKEVQRIRTIVMRLLDFARPGTSDATTVNFHELVSEVLILVEKQLQRMNVVVHTNLSQIPPTVGNPTRLKQVVLNLILNAMEAMPQGGDLTIEVYPERGGTALAVTDTGIGMDSETIAQIFEPFYSTKDDGTGLGLAVSYGIVQGHGGDIWVDSEPGRGSRFVLWLPNSTK